MGIFQSIDSVKFYVPLDNKIVILKTFFLANLLAKYNWLIAKLRFHVPHESK